MMLPTSPAAAATAASMASSALLGAAVQVHRKMLHINNHHGGTFEAATSSSSSSSSSGAWTMRALLNDDESDTHIALYIIIPFVSAIVGYVTNVMVRVVGTFLLTYYFAKKFPHVILVRV
jgi:hypothetical protein